MSVTRRTVLPMERGNKDGTLIVRAKRELIKALADHAESKGKSLSAWVRDTLIAAYKRGE